MSGDTSDRAPASAATTWLAGACVGLWLVAAASTGPLGIWPSIGGAAIALGVVVMVLDPVAARRLLVPSARLVLIGAAVGGLMAAGTHLLYPLFMRLSPFIATDMARLYASFRGPPPVFATLALLPVILGEELVWRGVVQTALVRRIGPWRGVPLAALTYALAHAPLRSPVLVAVALSCGIAWGALRTVTASLVPTLSAHLMWDVLVLLWYPPDRS